MRRTARRRLGAPGERRMKTARDILTRDVVTIGPDQEVSAIVDLFHLHGIGGIPVTDGKRKLLGLVTRTGLLDHALTAGGLEISPLLAAAAPGVAGQRKGPTARDLMAEKVFTTTPDTPVAKIAELMSAECIHRMPVVEDDRVVGIVTSLDVLRAFPGVGD